MKKKNVNLKLQLNKETIANLNNSQMNDIRGGEAPRTFLSICKSCVVSNCQSAPGCDCPDPGCSAAGGGFMYY